VPAPTDVRDDRVASFDILQMQKVGADERPNSNAKGRCAMDEVSWLHERTIRMLQAAQIETQQPRIQARQPRGKRVESAALLVPYDEK
jgi:hypothetical protein